MHRWYLFAWCVALLATLSGCGQKPAAAPASAVPTVVDIPVTMDSGVQVVALTANDAKHYNGNHFVVHTGQPVQVELTNIGIMPSDEMEHNFVVLKPGTDAMMYNLSSAMAKDHGYMPADQMDAVIAFTPMAGPGQTVQVQFIAPATGDYKFLCNYPGHYAAGMHGVMTVVP